MIWSIFIFSENLLFVSLLPDDEMVSEAFYVSTVTSFGCQNVLRGAENFPKVRGYWQITNYRISTIVIQYVVPPFSFPVG